MYNSGLRLWTALLLVFSLGAGAIPPEQPSTPATFGAAQISEAPRLIAGLPAEASTLRPSWVHIKKAPSVTASLADECARELLLSLSPCFDDGPKALISEA